MLTIFTTTKPFIGHDDIIQRNAIRSWLLLEPKCEIMLIGDDEGTAETASELGVKHIPDVECNEYGTPLVSSIFNTAQDIASNPVLCYINADIILLSDFLPAIQSIDKSHFLMVGQRWDVDIDEPLDFDNAEWESRLRDDAKRNGKLHPKTGIDYVVFSDGLFDPIPPFAIGRTTWDNWLIFRTRERKAAVIDATAAVLAIHQNHDYSYNTGGETNVWKGPESIINRELAGGGEHTLTIEHAAWKLTKAGLERASSLRSLYFRIDALLLVHPNLRFLHRLLRAVTQSLIYIRSRMGISQK